MQRLLGLANSAYVNKEYKEAVELFQQVIIKDPRVFQAWNTMGVIQEELGNTEKALQLYLVAAHITPKDGDLWKKLAQISKYERVAFSFRLGASRTHSNNSIIQSLPPIEIVDTTSKHCTASPKHMQRTKRTWTRSGTDP